MSESGNSEARPDNERQPRGQVRVVIPLPRSLSNMVFIEAMPLWLCLILGVVGLIVEGLCLLAGVGSHEGLIAFAVCLLIGAMGLLLLWHTIWRWAVEGHFAAITVLYVSYLLGLVGGPVLLLPMVAFVLPLPLLMLPAEGAGEGGLLTIALIGLVLLVLGVLGLAWILAFTNLLEWKLWEFARLDGLCPSCRQWRFGRIKRPGIITCDHCGATLEFVRADESKRGRS
jgi:hypothetical protein